MKVLESEMDSLPGKDNKKARNAKSREIAELKKELIESLPYFCFLRQQQILARDRDVP